MPTQTIISTADNFEAQYRDNAKGKYYLVMNKLRVPLHCVYADGTIREVSKPYLPPAQREELKSFNQELIRIINEEAN